MASDLNNPGLNVSHFIDRKPRQTVILYRWQDGTEEVRYRRIYGSPEAAKLIAEVEELQARHGAESPYFWRHE